MIDGSFESGSSLVGTNLMGTWINKGKGFFSPQQNSLMADQSVGEYRMLFPETIKCLSRSFNSPSLGESLLSRYEKYVSRKEWKRRGYLSCLSLKMKR